MNQDTLMILVIAAISFDQWSTYVVQKQCAHALYNFTLLLLICVVTDISVLVFLWIHNVSVGPKK